MARRPAEPDPGHAGEGREPVWRFEPASFRPASDDPAENVVRLVVNGEERSFNALGNVAALVAALGLDPRKVAVERNLEIVPRSTYAVAPIADGDRIEIVHFIGGG